MDRTENSQRAVLYINLGFLEYNYRAIKSILPEHVKVLCVVKADAYGHGAVRVAQRLNSIGVEYFGVATIDEAINLRKNGIETPLLIMSGILPWDDPISFLEYNLTPVVYDLYTLKRIAEAHSKFKIPLKIHIKFDTGMGRLGFMPHEGQYIIEILKNIDNIHIEGVMTHFSTSEIRDEYGLNQIKKFREVLEFLKHNNIEPTYIHMANSGGIINYPEAHFNMVRLGISLYGSYPDTSLKKKINLKQIMRLTSKIALIRDFSEKNFLSYGRTFLTQRKTRIAYVPLGYSDGYPRALSNKGNVLINDKRCCIVGRICMDWILIDITDCPDVKVGDEVVLLGYGGNDSITADEIAGLEGTIPYEVLCRLSKNIKRCYID